MRTTRYGALVCALLLGGLTGCGSDDGASAEEIRQAREEAASAARQDERIKQLERRLRQRERNSGADSGSGEPDQAPAAPAAPAAPSGRTSCGNSVSVGPNTSCPFAHSVRAAYEQSGGASTIRAYSPVTGVTYTMSCTGGSPHECTGGNDASVYFP